MNEILKIYRSTTKSTIQITIDQNSISTKYAFNNNPNKTVCSQFSLTKLQIQNKFTSIESGSKKIKQILSIKLLGNF